MRDTVFAVATAAGRAAVAVVRMSGPRAAQIAQTLCGALPPPRLAGLRRLKAGDEFLDEALVLWMPGPRSFTGEDCVEFQTHGGAAVVEAVCEAVASAGARVAEAGEFTRRAFEAGRLDLTQAEAVADLIDAETEAQRRQATAQLSGALSGRYRVWYDRLLDAAALIEAAIDFPDDDVPGGVASAAFPILRSVEDDLRRDLSEARGERVRSGIRIAIVGSPNVGKSSVFNALAGRDAAIVTEHPGTTRDVVEVQLNIKGHMVTVADTAGIRETPEPIEAEGVARARRWATYADLRIAVADASRSETLSVAEMLAGEADIVVLNKTDLVDSTPEGLPPHVVQTAVWTGQVDLLKTALEQKIIALTTGAAFPAVTRTRHRELLTECLDHLARASSGRQHGAELIGEDVRLAYRCLERLIGRGDPEAVLDRVFSTFCIGK